MKCGSTTRLCREIANDIVHFGRSCSINCSYSNLIVLTPSQPADRVKRLWIATVWGLAWYQNACLVTLTSLCVSASSVQQKNMTQFWLLWPCWLCADSWVFPAGGRPPVVIPLCEPSCIAIDRGWILQEENWQRYVASCMSQKGWSWKMKIE